MKKAIILQLIADKIAGQGNQVDIRNALPTVLEAMLENTEPELINYAALKTMRDAGELFPGKLYRITDYVATTTQEGTRSANHPFDIVVLATSTTQLSEDAAALLHDGDNYFKRDTVNLAGWKIKYSIDNDPERFVWADAENGKGVIFGLEDEYGNYAPFDFKGIQFERDTEWISNHESWCEEVLGAIPEESQWFYFLTWVDEDGVAQDASVVAQDIPNDESAYSGVYGNRLGLTSAYDMGIESAKTAFALPCTVLVSSYGYEDGLFYGIYSNTFGNYCSSNTFGNNCQDNTFGNDCSRNTFGNSCGFNTFGNNCFSNTFGNSCGSNTFGNSCGSNTFGNDCYYNTFGNDFFRNTIGNNCFSNTFGNDCYYNTFGNNCSYGSIGQGVNNVKVETSGSHEIKYFYIQNGTASSGNALVINFVADVTYPQVAGRDSSGNLQIWTPANNA